MKKEVKSKKMTIDKLAIMVADGFESMKAKMATKEALKTQQNVLDIVLEEIRTIHEDNKYFRKSISSLNIDGLSYEKRLEKLEAKVK
ncbi:hypothetical protein M0P48_05260 [Candidatus Gracilibacteria bacterium]|jgi:hypothetical protein|nr:hypothetical protein [Candidatus Gracilibacteria bacterium]